MNLDLYNTLSESGEHINVWDNEEQKQTVVSKDDFDLDRQGNEGKYVFSGNKGYFSDAEGNVVKSGTDDFYNFYDNDNYKYLDTDVLETVVLPKDELQTGEKVRDFLPKDKVFTAVANFSDALINNFTFGSADHINDQTRSEKLAEDRLREEAGGIGAVGTVLGEVAGIGGVTVATGGLGSLAAGAAASAKFLPKVAKGAAAAQKYLKTGKGAIHTGAVGGAYSTPWAISSAVQQKDIGKGAETMVWGTMIPFGGHAIAKGIGKTGRVVKEKIQEGFFSVPKKIKEFGNLKDKLSTSLTIDPNFLPDAIYKKVASKIKPGVVDLSSGLTTQAKKELIKNASKGDILDIYTGVVKQAHKAIKGSNSVPITRQRAYKALEQFQKSTGKSIGVLRKFSEKNSQVFSVKGKDVQTSLKKVIPDESEFLGSSDKSAIKQLKGFIDQLNPDSKYNLKTLKKLRDKFDDLAHFSKKTEPKFSEDLFRRAYSSMAKIEEGTILGLGKKLRVAGIGPKNLPNLFKHLETFKRQKARFATSASVLDSLNKASGGFGGGGGVIDKMLLYGGGIGIGYGGGPIGIAAALVGAAGIQKAGQVGTFLKPIESMASNVNAIKNFSNNLTRKSEKGLAGITISKISSVLAGVDNEEEDLNKLATSLGASLGEPAMAYPGTARKFIDGVFGDLNLNIPERKLSTANTFNTLEKVVLDNIDIMKPNDPDAQTKKKDFINNVEVLFSPDMLKKHIDQGTLTARQVDNFKGVYPRIYEELRSQIIMENEKNPVIRRLGYEKALTLSKFVGVDLTGLENYRQKMQPVNDENKQPSKEHDKYQFGNVSADLKKQIYTNKNILSRVEQF